jgi:hypothetical protein
VPTAEDEIAAGRLWKAVDRLQGTRAQTPANPRVLELLGRVHADMGNLPSAGLAWFLTDGKDPRREEAFAAMRERHGGGESLIGALGVQRVPIAEFPPGAQARLRALQAETGGRWDPPPRRVVTPAPMSLAARVGGAAGCLAAVLIAVVPWVHGLTHIFD